MRVAVSAVYSELVLSHINSHVPVAVFGANCNLAFSRGSRNHAVEISTMDATANNVVDGFRELRRFCADVSLMLKTANEMMGEAGWTRISRWTNAIEVSADLDNAESWLPDAFFCFYQHVRLPHVVSFIAVHVDDLYDETPIELPLISAGWANYGVGKDGFEEWAKDYSTCYSHVWIKNRTDDGTIHSRDARETWGNDEVDGQVKLVTFAHPLDEITSSETLKLKIVEPLLAELEKEPR
jgi:hypothetical protein